MENTKKDLLKLDYINSLPQPFIATMWNGVKYPIIDIDVESGLLRIDVCGKSEVSEIAEVQFFTDDNGNIHKSDDFYND